MSSIILDLDPDPQTLDVGDPRSGHEPAGTVTTDVPANSRAENADATSTSEATPIAETADPALSDAAPLSGAAQSVGVESSFGVMAAPAPAARTTADGLDIAQILHDRPDVFQAFYTEYYGPNHDRHSSAWNNRVGGETVQDYANYWYEKYGKWEGYSQEGMPAHEAIDIDQLLRDRPDVFQTFFTEYYGPDNDRHSSAWRDRVGGETVQDYAKYWYDHYGVGEGYTQHPAAAPVLSIPDAVDPGSQDPGNQDAPGAGVLDVGQSMTSPDPLT